MGEKGFPVIKDNYLSLINSVAGSEEQTPSMTTAGLVTLIKQAKREPVERDTLYNEIKQYKISEVQETATNSLLN